MRAMPHLPVPTTSRSAAGWATRGLAVAFACTLFGARPASAGDAYAKQMEAKAASVVIVKAVIKRSAPWGDSESNYEASGSVVDASGLVMIQGFNFGGGVKVNPTNLRVLFDGEEKAYDAVLGATDSKLGLAFVLVKDLADKKIVPLDFNSPAEPAVGDELFGVLRTDSGFDYAPYYGIAKLVGQVKQPREMWLVTGGMLQPGTPLYAADGKTAGVVIRQSGISEDGGSSRTFLLPMKAFTAVVVQANKASKKALDDAKAHEKEAAEAAAKDGAGMDTPVDGSKSGPGGMDEKQPDVPGMSDAPGMPDAPGMGDAGMGDAPKDSPRPPDAPTPEPSGMDASNK